MSITPDPFFRGNNVCNVCDKELNVNSVAITYHVYTLSNKKPNDLMFCAPCATKLTMSLAQDISRIGPEFTLSEYNNTKIPRVSLRRHASALEILAKEMVAWADTLDIAYGGSSAVCKTHDD